MSPNELKQMREAVAQDAENSPRVIEMKKQMRTILTGRGVTVEPGESFESIWKKFNDYFDGRRAEHQTWAEEQDQKRKK